MKLLRSYSIYKKSYSLDNYNIKNIYLFTKDGEIIDTQESYFKNDENKLVDVKILEVIKPKMFLKDEKKQEYINKQIKKPYNFGIVTRRSRLETDDIELYLYVDEKYLQIVGTTEFEKIYTCDYNLEQTKSYYKKYHVRFFDEVITFTINIGSEQLDTTEIKEKAYELYKELAKTFYGISEEYARLLYNYFEVRKREKPLLQ